MFVARAPFCRGVRDWKMACVVVASRLACLLALSCGNGTPPPPVGALPNSKPRVVLEHGPIARIEAPHELDKGKVDLGRRLFADARLSANGQVACSSCHDLSKGGADSVPFSRGVTGAPLSLNTPTVFNSALNFRQFWDGRAANLEEQVDGPLISKDEMGSSWPAVLSVLRADAGYTRAFARSYPRGIEEWSVKDALASFEASLSTPDAPFDRFLAGEADAIDANAHKGYELFTSYGCSACHQGRGVGGNMFQKLGVMADYFADRGHDSAADQGRFNVTHDEADRHVFKVPSLRNVALTAPYLHDGSLATLEDVIRVMARYQLGRDVDANDVGALAAFLRTLSGRYKGGVP